MVQQLINLVGAVLLCELLIELFYEAAPLSPLRRLLGIEDKLGYPLACGDDEEGRGCAWYSRLTGCGYCLSVWMGVLCAVAFNLRLFDAPWLPAAAAVAINGLIVHRLSNVWHGAVRRIIDTEGKLRERLDMLEGMSLDATEPDTEPEEATDSGDENGDRQAPPDAGL